MNINWNDQPKEKLQKLGRDVKVGNVFKSDWSGWFYLQTQKDP